MSDSSLPRPQLFQYALLALPLAFASLPLYIHAPDFYSRDVGLNIGVIGAILLAVRLFDALQDPLIGYLLDRHAAHRYPIIAAGALTLSLGMFAVFYGAPQGVPVALWFAASMVFATTGFSIVSINLNMIGGFWRPQPSERTRISAWREAFGLLGLLLASMLPTLLQKLYPAAVSFKILVWVFVALLLVAFAMFSRFMWRYAPQHLRSGGTTQRGLAFVSILGGVDKYFFGACLLTSLAVSMPAALVLFFIRDYMQAGNVAGVFLFLYFCAGAACMNVWVKLAAKSSKEKAWLAAMLVAVGVFVWAFFLRPGDLVAYAIICVLSGVTLGANLALPPAILADRITAQKTEREATQYYALLTFIPKTSFAVASGSALLTLGALGFVAGAQNAPLALRGLVVLYTLVPCAIQLAAAILLWCVIRWEGRQHAPAPPPFATHSSSPPRPSQQPS